MRRCGLSSRMNRGNFFVFVAVAIVCHDVCRSNGAAVPSARDDTENIGVRSMPDHESASMAEFKRGLDAEERDLLKRHMSKTRFIQPLVDSTLEMVNRHNKMVAEAEAVKKRSEGGESQCCSCRESKEGCYHPDDVKRSNIIRCCQSPPSGRESVAVDDREVHVDSEGEKALSELSADDRELLKKHLSKINNLVEAEQRPESNGNTERSADDDDVATGDESQEEIDAAGQQALNQLSPADKDLLQKYLSKIDNLVEAEQRPESNGNTDKREQTEKAKKDTVNAAAAGSVIQKLYDQLEGLKQVVGDLKAQQQQVQKKRAEEEAQSKRALDEVSQRFWADVHLAKEKGIKLNDLLEAMKKRAASNTKNGN